MHADSKSHALKAIEDGPLLETVCGITGTYAGDAKIEDSAGRSHSVVPLAIAIDGEITCKACLEALA